MSMSEMVAALLDGRIASRDAIATLMSRQPQQELLPGLEGSSTLASSSQ